MYTTNNFRYLRISKHSILPLNLLLSKDDLAWFNDYSFQEILTALKPLLLSRIDLFNQGHIVKRTINPIVSANSSTNPHLQDSEDGLEDAGVVFGGERSEDSATKRTKRRNAVERPQFGIRFGLRIHAPSERGGAVLIANKNLGFARIKAEEEVAVGNELGQEGTSGNQRSSSRRKSMGLASLEGEAPAGDGGPVVIQAEDESDNLRVSDFQREDVEQDQEAEDDVDYQDESASQRRGEAKRKNSTQGKGKGKRAKAADGSHQLTTQTDQKPTLQVSYGAMKLHPQTLYIVVRTMDSGLPPLSSVLPFTTVVEPTSTADKKGRQAQTEPSAAVSAATEEDEESLFPAGLDYFIDS
ncbi:hypothetical protein BGX33_002799 [Mortierella sp. NVP41]|nr:hypothetical protein BGX33_002799 [Mortierella sp. NVP41]